MSDGTGGTLVLVATPIGNLGDLAPRARDALARADLVCCEDTRRTRALLTHAGITGAKVLSVHAHNEADRVEAVVGRLAKGETIALVSDAGTPAVSDPGHRLVVAAVSAGATVTVVPGPSAALAALVVSGLDANRFCFEGFLPRRGAERRAHVAAIAAEGRTVVLFEAPGRLAATLDELARACGPERAVVVARELTKIHEEVWRGTFADAAAEFAGRAVRGEVVVVVDGAPSPPPALDAEVTEAVRRRLEAGDSLRSAAIRVAQELGVARRRAYDCALEVRRNARP
jgi:16S rRNA (cytidine1402-2'-O)-methyltransferase